MFAEPSKKSHPEPALIYLAQESQVSIDEVTQIYENELSKLEVEARVQVFLPIFAIRKVKEKLSQHNYRKYPRTMAGEARNG